MIALGSTNASKVYLGSEEISKIYLGDTQIWGGSSPTPVPPYDAQVEYLRSSGTQWFDLNHFLTNNSDTEIVYTSRGHNTNVFGCRVSVNSKCIMIALGDQNNNIVLDFNDSSNTPYRLVQNNFSASKIKLKLSKDVRGIYNMTTGVTVAENTTICNDVFTCETSAYLLSASGNPYYTTKFACDLYSCKIKENGILVRDLIPVRVAQVGYLYDNVSGELFGNAGTGSFVLGNDVT